MTHFDLHVRDRPHGMRRTVSAAAAAMAMLLASSFMATALIGNSGAVTPVAPRTLTVELTAEGPVPADVALHAGDSVRFVNDTHPGVVALTAVSITITGATRTAFALPPGAAATVGPYTGVPYPPQPIRYTARYHASLANGLVPAGDRRTDGSIDVVEDSSPRECNTGQTCP